jgi:hypothetical protein
VFFLLAAVGLGAAYVLSRDNAASDDGSAAGAGAPADPLAGLTDAIGEGDLADPPPAPPPPSSGTTGAWPPGPIKVNITTYCPFAANLSAAQRAIEGGPTDRLGHPLYTIEAHLSDPSTAPYCSCAGDPSKWSYGQQVELPGVSSQAIFRVVDTGAAFHGPPWYASSGEPEPHVTAGAPRKKIRVDGYEPIDVCVQACGTGAYQLGAQTGTVP